MTAIAHSTSTRPGRIKTGLVNLRRRRTYLIDPRLQFKITRQFVLVLITASGLSLGNYHVFQTLLAEAGHDEVSMVMSYGYCATMVAISGSLLFLLCVFFSHRIAGPARKVCEALNHMAHGDLCVKVRLRDTDLLTEMADAINAANRDLRASLGEVDREIRRARSLAGESQELGACLARAERLLSEFQITTALEMDAREVASRGARGAAKAA